MEQDGNIHSDGSCSRIKLLWVQLYHYQNCILCSRARCSSSVFHWLCSKFCIFKWNLKHKYLYGTQQLWKYSNQCCENHTEANVTKARWDFMKWKYSKGNSSSSPKQSKGKAESYWTPRHAGWRGLNQGSRKYWKRTVSSQLYHRSFPKKQRQRKGLNPERPIQVKMRGGKAELCRHLPEGSSSCSP